MKPFVIVEGEIPPQAKPQCGDVLVAPDVEVLVLHTPPEPLDEDVIQRPAPAVHTHRHPGRLQAPRARLGRELHPWSGLDTAGRPPLRASFGLFLPNGIAGLID